MADVIHIPLTRLPTGSTTDTVTLTFDDGVEEIVVLELLNRGTGVARIVVLSADSGNLLTDVRADAGETKRAIIQNLPRRISFYVESLNGTPEVQVTDLTGAGAVLPGDAQDEPDDINTYLGRTVGETVPPWLSTITVSPTDSVKDAIEALDIQSSAVGIARQNYVVVNDLSDFPTPVGGVITLVSGIVYEINGPVDIGTNRIDASATVCIRGLCNRQDSLVTNNASTLFTTTGSIEMEHLTLTNTGGPVFSASGTLADRFVIRSIDVSGSVSVGTVQDYGVVSIRRLVVMGTSDGLTVDGTNGFFVMNSVLATANLGTFTFLTIPAAAAFSGIGIETGAIDIGAGQTGFDIDPTVTVVARAAVTNYVFSGVGTPLTGITKGTIGWKFRDNVGILDSISVGEVSFENNTTETVINTVDVFENINPGPGGWVLNFTERFSEPSDGLLQYNGTEAIVALVEIMLGAEPKGAGLDDWSLRATINGIQLFRTRSTFVKAAQPTHLTLIKVVDLNPGDQIRAQVANNSDTSNILVNYAIMSVRIVV